MRSGDLPSRFLNVEPGYVFMFEDMECIVRNRCSAPRVDSFWLCANHGLKLVGVDDLAIHLAKPGQHLALWHCPEHGPEVP